MLVDGENMSNIKTQLEQLMAQVEALKAQEKAQEKAEKILHKRAENEAKPISFRMGPTGGIVADNVGSGYAKAVSLYPRQWRKLKEQIDSIVAFADANEQECTRLELEATEKRAAQVKTRGYNKAS